VGGLLGLMACLAGLSGSVWTQQPAVGLSGADDCTSVARRDRSFALGCRSGVWTLDEAGLRQGINCPVSSGSFNRVRALGRRGFVASSPCGLFLLLDGAAPRLIPLPDPPGALAVIDPERLLVMAGDQVYAVDLVALRALRVAGLPAGEQIHRIGWSALGLSVHGRRTYLWRGGYVPLQPPAPAARVAAAGSRGLIWIGVRGRVWLQAAPSRFRMLPGLPLLPGERIRRVVDLGQDRVWVASRMRWFVLGRDQVHSGPLPGGPGPFVPVRGCSLKDGGEKGEVVRGPIWLAGPQALYSPKRGLAASSNWCPAFSGSVAGQAWADLPDGSLAWLLPEVQLKAWGGRDWRRGFFGQGGWSHQAARSWGVAVLLAWPLGAGHQWLNWSSAVGVLRRERTYVGQQRALAVERLHSERARLCAGPVNKAARLRLSALDQLLSSWMTR
jgi:hypothetical protein